MRAADLLLRRRPRAHLVVAGEERVAYGTPLPEGDSWRRRMLAELVDLDRTRVHFVGPLPYREYRRLLQASAAHVYLTIPFVLSWSMLEAMACGCLLVASATPPVEEVVTDGRNGLLVDFFDHEQLAATLDRTLERPEAGAPLRDAARATILDRYDQRHLLPRHVAPPRGPRRRPPPRLNRHADPAAVCGSTVIVHSSRPGPAVRVRRCARWCSATGLCGSTRWPSHRCRPATSCSRRSPAASAAPTCTAATTPPASWPPPSAAACGSSTSIPSADLVMGHELSGRVLACGDGVEELLGRHRRHRPPARA